MDMFWKSKNWELNDKHFRSLEQAPFRRKLPMPQISPGVTLIRGPRQIGKSTWLKLLLQHHVKRGDSCFFYTCEDLEDYRDLSELLKSQKGTRYFFLDEVTFVKEWWRAIKKIVDTDADVCLVLTGSNSYDLRQGLDLMPGRWSPTAGELSLLPMPFEEWSEMRLQARWPTLPLLEGLRAYMRVGGFPAAMAEAGAKAMTPTHALHTYQRWIMGDVIKLGRQEAFMKELLVQLVKTMGSSISLQKLAQKTQLMSYHTVQDYISILEHAFALRTVYAYDPETDTFRFKKEKKFYFTDPIVYWAVLDLAGISATPDHEEQMAEMLAAEWLSRRYKRMGYYSSQNGEVDFISEKKWAVEIKWANAVHNLSKAYKNLHIAHKSVWFQGHFFRDPNRS